MSLAFICLLSRQILLNRPLPYLLIFPAHFDPYLVCHIPTGLEFVNDIHAKKQHV